MEVKQIIDEALEEWYSERGLKVPNWRMKKNPQWWVNYLNDLGIDQQNSQWYNYQVDNGVQLSLVERCFWEAEVVGSNPVTPIHIYYQL